jgi:hypothetical protein
MGMCRWLPLWRLVPLAALFAVAVVGCGSTEIDPAAVANLKGVAGLYTDYSSAHSNNGPPDIEKLKAHARAMDLRSLGGVGVDISRLDEYFTSPRDKQPLQIRFNTPVTNLGRSAPLLAHEQTGVRGKKLAVYANNKVEELDEAGLKQAIEGKAPPG